ncbi:hypothetical protein C8R46DRAFT_1283061 [Mycena filopes]|nr:hypothetical protein C8R46DRAFT_1283061 [Mycena filopes]
MIALLFDFCVASRHCTRFGKSIHRRIDSLLDEGTDSDFGVEQVNLVEFLPLESNRVRQVESFPMRAYHVVPPTSLMRTLASGTRNAYVRRHLKRVQKWIWRSLDAQGHGKESAFAAASRVPWLHSFWPVPSSSFNPKLRAICDSTICNQKPLPPFFIYKSRSAMSVASERMIVARLEPPEPSPSAQDRSGRANCIRVAAGLPPSLANNTQR